MRGAFHGARIVAAIASQRGQRIASTVAPMAGVGPPVGLVTVIPDDRIVAVIGVIAVHAAARDHIDDEVGGAR